MLSEIKLRHLDNMMGPPGPASRGCHCCERSSTLLHCHLEGPLGILCVWIRWGLLDRSALWTIEG